MRIISGEYRGFKLKAPKGTSTRPTTDRVKESIFSIVESKKPITSSAEVLDLFSGSGGIGLEFLSRGADRAVFIDSDSSSVSVIKENIAKCKVESRTEVYKNDVIRGMSILAHKSRKFDYIFMDPPYEENMVPKVIETIYNSDMLKEKGLIIAEHEPGLEFEGVPGKVDRVDCRKYGSTEVSFYEIKEDGR